MAWIKSMQELKDHPKLLMLMEKTGWSKPEAIGNLHIFWWWVLSYAEDGDLSRMSLDTPIGNIDLKKLVECGFIDDKTFLVHDWFDYAGRYLTAKYHQTNPSRLKQIERKYKSKSRTTNRTSLGNPKGHTNFPLDRLRQIKIDKEKEKLPANAGSSFSKSQLEDMFNRIWIRYPRREGRADALTAFKRDIKSEADWMAIKIALENYKEHLEKEKTDVKYIQQGKRWFRNWRDWQSDPTEPNQYTAHLCNVQTDNGR